jgi:UDP-glucose 4-epimerase
VLALRALEGDIKSETYNLGIGKGFSVKEVIDAARSVTGRTISINEGPRRPGDPPKMIADSSRAQRQLGWIPRYQSIERIVETAWNWELCYQSRLASLAPHLV